MLFDIVELTTYFAANLWYFSLSLTSILASTNLQALWTDGGPTTQNSTSKYWSLQQLDCQYNYPEL